MMVTTVDTPSSTTHPLAARMDTTSLAIELLTAADDTTNDTPHPPTALLRAVPETPPRRKRITKIGQRLREARITIGADQKTFAAMTFVSDRTLSRWENGGAAPSPEQAHRILEACDDAPADVYNALAELLGIELIERLGLGATPSPKTSPKWGRIGRTGVDSSGHSIAPKSLKLSISLPKNDRHRHVAKSHFRESIPIGVAKEKRRTH
jgi:transcriptional regulator with XRE-family HTH domain